SGAATTRGKSFGAAASGGCRAQVAVIFAFASGPAACLGGSSIGISKSVLSAGTVTFSVFTVPGRPVSVTSTGCLHEPRRMSLAGTRFFIPGFSSDGFGTSTLNGNATFVATDGASTVATTVFLSLASSNWPETTYTSGISGAPGGTAIL